MRFIERGNNKEWRDAQKLLMEHGFVSMFNVNTSLGEITGLEVFCSGLLMDDDERKIKELFPEKKVYGLKNNEKIYIE
jgi:hypothetical protein